MLVERGPSRDRIPGGLDQFGEDSRAGPMIKPPAEENPPAGASAWTRSAAPFACSASASACGVASPGSYLLPSRGLEAATIVRTSENS
jgi:hypothetical protein